MTVRLWISKELWALTTAKNHYKFKRTKDELFSERNNYHKVYRFCGYSFIIWNWKNYDPPTNT